MQTFLPLPDFVESAKALDSKRLNKQKVECKQILNVLLKRSRAWRRHPAVLMWEGYIPALVEYSIAITHECINRGMKDTLLPYFLQYRQPPPITYPPWIGLPKFHLSHQSNLCRKNPIYYGPKFPQVPPDLPYYWPSSEFAVE